MAHRIQSRPVEKKPDKVRIAIIIIANNEASVIEALVLSVKKRIGLGDQVYVIADNCNDATARLAARSGAMVLDRKTGGPEGKGAALQWFVELEKSTLMEYQLLGILDADSQIPSNFIEQARLAYLPDSVLQCNLQPINFEGSPIGTLSALSEIMEQRTFDQIRSALRWPVRLRGTGMLIPPSLLFKFIGKIRTEVEDIVLSLLFSSSGIPIRKTEKVTVYDPKPQETSSASRQRARWFRGQWVAFWNYRAEVGKLILSGPSGWSLLGSLFLKPRWLVDIIIFLLALCSYFFVPAISAFLGIIIVFDIVCLIYTISLMENKKNFGKAILFFPAFIIMWLRGFLLATQKSTWRRGRE